ncbi:MAG: glutaredoxin domain-containing protein [Porticoccus sp.]|nr:glutaredoxin domain-containing protein [Porticoccus sp.]
MKRFTIFGHDACGFCRQAKAVLESKNLEFRYVNIHEEGISPADLAETVGRPVNTVPQIFHGKDYVGGYQELMQYLEQEDI